MFFFFFDRDFAEFSFSFFFFFTDDTRINHPASDHNGACDVIPRGRMTIKIVRINSVSLVKLDSTRMTLLRTQRPTVVHFSVKQIVHRFYSITCKRTFFYNGFSATSSSNKRRELTCSAVRPFDFRKIATIKTSNAVSAKSSFKTFARKPRTFRTFERRSSDSSHRTAHRTRVTCVEESERLSRV